MSPGGRGAELVSGTTLCPSLQVILSTDSYRDVGGWQNIHTAISLLRRPAKHQKDTYEHACKVFYHILSRQPDPDIILHTETPSLSHCYLDSITSHPALARLVNDTRGSLTTLSHRLVPNGSLPRQESRPTIGII